MKPGKFRTNTPDSRNGKYLWMTFEVDGLPVVVIGDTLAKAIAQLSPEKREVILLSYFLGMSDREISQRLNVVRQTITKRRNAALKILRNYLTEEGQE